jgi:hypothetical protein
LKKMLPSEHEILDNCLLDLWRLRKEMDSYAVLFQKVDSSDLEGDSLLGTGLAFEDMSKKLNSLSDRLNLVFKARTNFGK